MSPVLTALLAVLGYAFLNFGIILGADAVALLVKGRRS